MAAVILGASTGVGAAIAEALSLSGYYTIGFHRGRHPEEAQQVRVNQMIQADVGRDRDSVNIWASGLKEHLEGGKVHVLVHALSGAALGTCIGSSPREIERTFNYLAHSFLWWVQELVQRNMLDDNASIIALGNPVPDFYLRNTGVIGAAKAALESYVKMLAVEFGNAVAHFPRGVRVNCVRFSTVLTPALRAVLSPEAIAQLDAVHQSIVPARRMQTAGDVADFVVSLVSDTWINGAILDCTGGPTLTLMDHVFYGGR